MSAPFLAVMAMRSRSKATALYGRGDRMAQESSEKEHAPFESGRFASPICGTLRPSQRARILALRSGKTARCGRGVFLAAGECTTLAPPPQRLTPVQVPVLNNVVAISADYAALAVRAEGTVWAWHDANALDLLPFTANRSLAPVRVPGFSNVVAVAAGAFHNLALTRSGTVWSWGANSDGQLGDGTTVSRLFVVRPGIPHGVVQASIDGVVSIAAGRAHSLAIKSDGTVWTWGLNDAGQLGNGAPLLSGPMSRPWPAQVPGLSGIVAVSGGLVQSYALDSRETVWAWGSTGL